MRAFGGMGKSQNQNKSSFSVLYLSKPFDIFIDRIYSAVSFVKMK